MFDKSSFSIFFNDILFDKFQIIKQMFRNIVDVLIIDNHLHFTSHYFNNLDLFLDCVLVTFTIVYSGYLSFDHIYLC